jgi:excisionase family DNA binding protein
MKAQRDTQHQSLSFLTPAELAAKWKVTTITLRRWRKAGKLHASFIGRGVRFSPEEIARFEHEARA